MPVGASLKTAFAEMLQHDAGWVAVLDGDRYLGVLTPATLHEALRRSVECRPHRARPRGRSSVDDGRRPPSESIGSRTPGQARAAGISLVGAGRRHPAGPLQQQPGHREADARPAAPPAQSTDRSRPGRDLEPGQQHQQVAGVEPADDRCRRARWPCPARPSGPSTAGAGARAPGRRSRARSPSAVASTTIASGGDERRARSRSAAAAPRPRSSMIAARPTSAAATPQRAGRTSTRIRVGLIGARDGTGHDGTTQVAGRPGGVRPRRRRAGRPGRPPRPAPGQLRGRRRRPATAPARSPLVRPAGAAAAGRARRRPRSPTDDQVDVEGARPPPHARAPGRTASSIGQRPLEQASAASAALGDDDGVEVVGAASGPPTGRSRTPARRRRTRRSGVSVSASTAPCRSRAGRRGCCRATARPGVPARPRRHDRLRTMVTATSSNGTPIGASGLCTVTSTPSTRGSARAASASRWASVSIRSTGSPSTDGHDLLGELAVVDGVGQVVAGRRGRGVELAARRRRRTPGRRALLGVDAVVAEGADPAQGDAVARSRHALPPCPPAGRG